MTNRINLQELASNPIQRKKEIVYEEDDNLELTNIQLFKCKLIDLGLKRLVSSTCAITQTDIEKCYLREARFKNVDFTGSNFIDCDLEKATFNSCNLRYVTFRNCKLNLKEILGCLPSEPNLKVALLKELRMNQLGLGDNKSADWLLIKIHDTEKELLLERVKCSTSYHREKEDFISRTLALFSYIMLQLNDFIWGYGLKLSRLFRTALIILLSFAILTYFFTGKEYMYATVKGNEMIKLNFWQSLYASYTNFTTVGYGHFTPTKLTSTLLFSIENFLGLIFLGFLVSGVYRRIAK
ncbi:pentapeptide repeat-containing protein [Priestia megaterium]|uniref:pentapeptide repeat-containing protein n=1 Tax=Priestia megaterium TaxID=1404 RepID=UPI00244BACAA|nr:pentapeptide repeat-containing protein [Priestia megaterium]MDH2364161.1 pentapeptide repeat-containing protein [Priestia megaterium]